MGCRSGPVVSTGLPPATSQAHSEYSSTPSSIRVLPAASATPVGAEADRTRLQLRGGLVACTRPPVELSQTRNLPLGVPQASRLPSARRPAPAAPCPPRTGPCRAGLPARAARPRRRSATTGPRRRHSPRRRTGRTATAPGP